MLVSEIIQAPVFSRADLQSAGMSERTIRRRISGGYFVSVGPGLLTTVGRSADPDVLSIAAHRRTGFPLTGPSAAAFFPEGPVLEQVAHERPWLIGRELRRVDAVVLSNVAPEVVDRHGLLVASPRQAAMDCIRVLDDAEGLDLVHRCVQQRLLRVADLDAEVARLGRRAGVDRLREAADAVRTNAHSRSENDFHQVLREAGFDGWVANLWVAIDGVSYCIDVAFPELKLAIEYDSPMTHGSPSRFRQDRKKWNALKRAGWVVLNYTRESITVGKAVTVAEIEHFLKELRRAS